MLTTSLLIGLAAAIAALATAVYCLPMAQPRPAKSDARHMDSAIWMPGWPHEAPARPFTVTEAHQVMQSHRACKRDTCARKDAAWMALVDAGQIHPRLPLIGGIQ